MVGVLFGVGSLGGFGVVWVGVGTKYRRWEVVLLGGGVREVCASGVCS